MLIFQDSSGFKNVDFKELKPKAFDNENIMFLPKDYSDYFDLQFKCNDSNSTFIYYTSDERINLIQRILQLINKPHLLILKLCGPSAIGKSMTLFFFSKNRKNIMYINLKTIKELNAKFEYAKIYNLIIESLYYFDFCEEQKTSFIKILENLKGYKFYDILDKIINFLIDNDIKSIIILDQFKEGNIDIDKYQNLDEKIIKQKNMKVNLILCASTNDKGLRNRLIEDWKSKNFLDDEIPINAKECSFYIENLNIKKTAENQSNLYDIILSEFNYLPKYMVIFKNLQNNIIDFKQLVSQINEIESKLKNNLFSLYKNIIIKENPTEEEIFRYMINCLKKIDNKAGKEIKYNELEDIVSISSFKYMKFNFNEGYFTIDYCFRFFSSFVHKLIDQEVIIFSKKIEIKLILDILLEIILNY